MSVATLIRETFSTKTTPKPAPLPPLAAALAKLDIDVFERLSVERYKREKLESTLESLVKRYLVAGYKRIQEKRSEYTVGRVLGPEFNDAAHQYMQFPGHTPVLIALKWFRGAPTTGIPEHVSNKMCQITSEIPGVTFETDTLRDAERPYDPFIVAKFGGEEYYFEVWGDDDKAFER